jgi:putative membrane protein
MSDRLRAPAAPAPSSPSAKRNFPAPRVEAEDLPSPRLETELETIEPQPPERRSWGLAALVGGGAAILLLGLAGTETVEIVSDAFLRSPILGSAAFGAAAIGFSMIALGVWRELAALSALRGVDKLRAALSGTDAVRRARAAREWLRELPEGPSLLPALNAINDPDAIIALLRAGPGTSLRAQADALGRAAAVQSVAGIAAMPSPGLAALFVAWRGLRLIRQIAALHGLRPGLFATIGLLRRTALSAGAVAGVEIATNTAAHALLSSGLVQQFAGEMAGAGVAARRMLVLARAATVACSPLPEG